MCAKCDQRKSQLFNKSRETPATCALYGGLHPTTSDVYQELQNKTYYPTQHVNRDNPLVTCINVKFAPVNITSKSYLFFLILS